MNPLLKLGTGRLKALNTAGCVFFSLGVLCLPYLASKPLKAGSFLRGCLLGIHIQAAKLQTNRRLQQRVRRSVLFYGTLVVV